MVALLAGIAMAAVAATLFSLGVAVQAMEARNVPSEHALRLSLITRLMRSGRWLAGTGLTVLGWPFQVVALLLAPIVIVQPALALGVLVLLALGKYYLHEPVARRDLLACAAIIAGVAGIAAIAPGVNHHYVGGITLAVCIGGLWAVSTAPYLLRLIGRDVPVVTMLSAGMAFAAGGVASALVADEIHQGHLLAAAAWALSSAVLDGLGVLSEMSALQRRPAVQVSPVVLVAQTVVPVALAPVLFHEGVGGVGPTLILIAALSVLAAGAVGLVRSPALLAFVAPGEGASAESGTGSSPEDSSVSTTRDNPRSDDGDPPSVTTTMSPARTGP